MLDHVGIEVSDLHRSKAFYSAALAPLGYSLAYEFEGGAGFGSAEGVPDFWLHAGDPKTGTHVAFQTKERGAVHAFHEAGLAAGGRDNGPPGPRPHYGPTYYAAFVHDPDGHNVEAVCHEPE
jgi:catechol 2,3-dioxygenase-like lactoylglutathione lyase family enzyme